DLHRGRRGPGRRRHRLLPDRRALLAHLVRPARAAGPAEREELRRLLDRVRVPGGRPGRAGGGEVSVDGCGAPVGGVVLSEGAAAAQVGIQGVVSRGGTGLSGAYARLLSGSGDFVGEVATGEEGSLGFCAADGGWKVRVLAAQGLSAEFDVRAEVGKVADLAVQA